MYGVWNMLVCRVLLKVCLRLMQGLYLLQHLTGIQSWCMQKWFAYWVCASRRLRSVHRLSPKQHTRCVATGEQRTVVFSFHQRLRMRHVASWCKWQKVRSGLGFTAEVGLVSGCCSAYEDESLVLSGTCRRLVAPGWLLPVLPGISTAARFDM